MNQEFTECSNWHHFFHYSKFICTFKSALCPSKNIFGIIYTIHKQKKIKRCSTQNDLNDIKNVNIAIDFCSKIQLNQQAYWPHRSFEQHFLHKTIDTLDNLCIAIILHAFCLKKMERNYRIFIMNALFPYAKGYRNAMLSTT